MNIKHLSSPTAVKTNWNIPHSDKTAAVFMTALHDYANGNNPFIQNTIAEAIVLTERELNKVQTNGPTSVTEAFMMEEIKKHLIGLQYWRDSVHLINCAPQGVWKRLLESGYFGDSADLMPKELKICDYSFDPSISGSVIVAFQNIEFKRNFEAIEGKQDLIQLANLLEMGNIANTDIPGVALLAPTTCITMTNDAYEVIDQAADNILENTRLLPPELKLDYIAGAVLIAARINRAIDKFNQIGVARRIHFNKMDIVPIAPLTTAPQDIISLHASHHQVVDVDCVLISYVCLPALKPKI